MSSQHPWGELPLPGSTTAVGRPAVVPTPSGPFALPCGQAIANHPDKHYAHLILEGLHRHLLAIRWHDQARPPLRS